MAATEPTRCASQGLGTKVDMAYYPAGLRRMNLDALTDA
jgi:hypothetical protein